MRRLAARRVGKAGRKSEGRPVSPLSSISDKNKVNGEWGLPEGWLLQHRGQWGNSQEELLRGGGNDAFQTRTYQSEWGKAKNTAIDTTGHASVFFFSTYLQVSRVSQGDPEFD